MIPGIDGMFPAGSIDSGECCPPSICEITPESLICNFINLLPSGPLWDEAKREGINCPTWCDTGCPTDSCGSLVSYAAFVGRRLHSMISDNLWPTIRETSPYTAYDSLDSWLERLRWRDCYMGTCRLATLGELTPYEIMGECGPEYCPPTFPRDLELAYKRGVVIALHRMRMKPPRTVAAINFILQSLYSELVIDPKYNPDDPESKLCLILRPTGDYGLAVVPEACPRTDQSIADAQKTVRLFMTPADGICAGGPNRVYPLTLAAHCIVLALMQNCGNVCIKRIP